MLAIRLNADSRLWETPSATEQALYAFARTVLAYARRHRPDAAPQGWQPIETAPKDGTWFFGGHVCGGVSETVYNAIYDVWTDRLHAAWQPTHWQPLPSPPLTDAPEGQ